MIVGDGASCWRTPDHGMDPKSNSKELLPNITGLETIRPNRLTMPELNTICADIIAVKSSTERSPQRIVASPGGAVEEMAATQPPRESRIPRPFGIVSRSCLKSMLNAAVQEG